MKLTVRMTKRTKDTFKKWHGKDQQVYLIYIYNVGTMTKIPFHLFFLLSHSEAKMSIHFEFLSYHFLAHSQNDKVIYEIAFD